MISPGKILQSAGICCLIILLSACAHKTPPSAIKGQPRPYRVGNTWYKPLSHAENFRQRGLASWYGRKFHGRKTSSGEVYNMYAMTAAHKILPLGTLVKVRNLDNKKTIQVRINDRGPFIRGRIIDLSYTAAEKLGVVGPGTARVEVIALSSRQGKNSGSSRKKTRAPVDYFKGHFTLQIGAFSDLDNAQELKIRLAGLYNNAHIVVFNNGHETFYRVRVGKCTSLEQALKYEKILLQDGYEEAMIVAE